MLNLANTVPSSYLRWDHRDMIASLNLGGGGTAYYQYDAEKQRTRKRIVNQNNLGGYWERIYLGGYELYRRYNGNGTALVEEIESHHLFEGEQRVLLVDDVHTASGSTHPRPDGLTVTAQTLFRYQYSNHLGSACLELDHQAQIISYEEYHPYGTSAYRTAKSGIEAPPKRYRYTGMERDEESGLGYHGARYYAPWLTRWCGVDPALLSDGPNLYVYVLNTPIGSIDHTGTQTQRDIARARELEAKYPFALHTNTSGWEGIVPSARVLDHMGVGTEAYAKIDRAEDMGRAATVSAKVSLGFAGGEILGPLLSAAPKVIQGIMAVPATVSSFFAGVRATEAATGTTITNDKLQGWDRVDRGVDAAVDLAPLAVAKGKSIVSAVKSTASIASRWLKALPEPRGHIDLAPWKKGGGASGSLVLRKKSGESVVIDKDPFGKVTAEGLPPRPNDSDLYSVVAKFKVKGAKGNEFTLELVPRGQHTAAGPVQSNLHPGQKGGFKLGGGEGSRDPEFQAANEELYKLFKSDPVLAGRLNKLFPGIVAHVQPGAKGAFRTTAATSPTNT
jgi:RHS repeat-associated protein